MSSLHDITNETAKAVDAAKSVAGNLTDKLYNIDLSSSTWVCIGLIVASFFIWSKKD
ncbi:MAG: hypothetical protein ACJA0H_000419 [Francisellaceae bacterium]|jgi:hypothetical protein